MLEEFRANSRFTGRNFAGEIFQTKLNFPSLDGVKISPRSPRFNNILYDKRVEYYFTYVKLLRY